MRTRWYHVAWRLLTLPALLAYWAYWGLRCGVGLHDWYDVRRPHYYRENDPVAGGWSCYTVCRKCRREQLGTWHIEPAKPGEIIL